MKRIIILVFILIGTKTVFSQINSLKIGVLGMAIGDYSVGIEQIIHSNYSVNYNVGYLDFKAGLINLPHFFDDRQSVWLQGVGSGWHGSVEMRTYFGRNSQDQNKKFYWGPYVRFWNNSLQFGDYINNDNVNEQYFDVNTKFKGVGVGAQFGYHILLNDVFWVDFYFFGLGADHITMNVDYRAVDTTDFDYSLIEDDVKDAFSNQRDFIKTNVEVWRTNGSLNIKLPVWLPGFRAGINIAYSF